MTCGNLASSSWLNSQCCDFCHLLDLVRGGLCSVDRSVVHFIQSNKRVQKLTSVNGPVPPLSLSAFMWQMESWRFHIGLNANKCWFLSVPLTSTRVHAVQGSWIDSGQWTCSINVHNLQIWLLFNWYEDHSELQVYPSINYKENKWFIFIPKIWNADFEIILGCNSLGHQHLSLKWCTCKPGPRPVHW